MADPTDAVAVAEVEHLTGCQVEPNLLPLGTVEELVERSYRHLVTEVMKRETATEPRREARKRRRPSTGAPGANRAKPEPIEPPGPEITAQVGVDELRRRGEPRSPPSATLPYSRPSDSDLALRHRALVELLIEKNLLSEEELEARVLAVKRRGEGG
jgi:hypothetical protein